MLRCLTAFLNFCYLVRRESIDEESMDKIDQALARFHTEREIFKETGIRIDFNLPRQHSLVHYRRNIQLFGAPNGLCSSITESKHIKAVKEPWRRSNHYEALGQMLVTNQRIDKLSALCAHFASHGTLVDVPAPPVPCPGAEDLLGEADALVFPGPKVMNVVTLAKHRGM